MGRKKIVRILKYLHYGLKIIFSFDKEVALEYNRFKLMWPVPTFSGLLSDWKKGLKNIAALYK